MPTNIKQTTLIKQIDGLYQEYDNKVRDVSHKGHKAELSLALLFARDFLIEMVEQGIVSNNHQLLLPNLYAEITIWIVLYNKQKYLIKHVLGIFSISKKRINEIRDLFSTDFFNSGCNQIELLEAIVLDMIEFYD